jgi:hypothetical protein
MVTTDTEISYSAIGKFTGDQMSGSQVKTVLEATNRSVIKVVGDAVQADVIGKISGNFVLRVVSRIEDNEEFEAPCLAYAKEFNKFQKVSHTKYI